MKTGDLVRLKCDHSKAYLITKVVTPYYVTLHGFESNQVFRIGDLSLINYRVNHVKSR